MFNANQRIDYILNYLSSYKNKIQLANQLRLFDAAKVFELFALNISIIWFKQTFINLNTEHQDYPHVDLISNDNKRYIQVSTAQDIQGKITETLKGITKDARFSQLENVCFFMLDNTSTDRVHDLVGNKQIGNIPFLIKNDLITTQEIAKRAVYDLEFQIKLFELLKEDNDKRTELEILDNELLAIIKNSKDTIQSSIDCCIHDAQHGEYQIDRSKLIDQIKKDNHQFISIQGSAGTGKSALCKMFLENEPLVLYARAERFTEETNINNIWAVDITRVIEYLNGKKLIFFIDALEYISDCPKTKHELLQQLYSIAKRHNNVYIITSCRSSEKGAFIKLESTYNIRCYPVNELSKYELDAIAFKYPIIKDMTRIRGYCSLICLPFYINLLLSKGFNLDDVHDDCSFRNHIWDKVICLKDCAESKYRLQFGDIIKTVKQIILERAQNDSTGILLEGINSKIFKALVSEDVLLVHNNHVRLKYDIFEDICFEQIFDENFAACRGNYRRFFETVENLGKSAYRRYQIWVSDKLFGISNRIKFLHNIIFTYSIPDDWRKQTEIGIVKSRYCSEFFEEQGEYIYDNDLLNEFIEVTNLYGFQARIDYSSNSNPKLDLSPMGNGRPALIKLIFKDRPDYSESIVKLCNDYGKQIDIQEDVASNACSICSQYVDELMNLIHENDSDRLVERITPCLDVLYRFAAQASTWIDIFYKLIVDLYISKDVNKVHFAENIIQWTMNNPTQQLCKSMAKQLLSLADMYWTYPKNECKRIRGINNRLETELPYTLGINARDYSYDYQTVDSNIFLRAIFFFNINDSIDWCVSFINRSISAFADINNTDISNIEIYFTKTKEKKEYLGSAQMWLSGFEEYHLPILLSDIIYLLKDAIINYLQIYLSKNTNLAISLANSIKNKLYDNSNNVALLTIIECIGFHFYKEMPGFALDLATSKHLLSWDNERYAYFCDTPTKALLEKHILQTVGISHLTRRYTLDRAYMITLQNYLLGAQFCDNDSLKRKCEDILDFLYNNADGTVNLPIESMDARKAQIKIINNNEILVKPCISERFESLVLENDKKEYLFNQCNTSLEQALNGDFDHANLTERINEVVKALKCSQTAFRYENILIALIAYALNNSELDKDIRTEYCQLWIDGIRRIFKNGSFAADTSFSWKLFQQIYSNAEQDTINDIKRLVLDLMLYHDSNGLILEYAKVAKCFLSQDKTLSRSIFNTIMKLSECMNNNVYCVNDIQLQQIEKVIHTYLFNASSASFDNFDIINCHLPALVSALSCGIELTDPFFYRIVKDLVIYIIDLCHFQVGKYIRNNDLNFYLRDEVIKFFQNQIVLTASFDNAKIAIDILFTDIDYSKFIDVSVEFYEEILDLFIAEFIDGWEQTERRRLCIKKLKFLEHRICAIDNKYSDVKSRLFCALCLSTNKHPVRNINEYKTDYKYCDKVFLNDQFKKYGHYNLNNMLEAIYQLHVDKLLPEILISLNKCFDDVKSNGNSFSSIVTNKISIIRMIIYKSYIYHSDEIKDDEQLMSAYEGILEKLVELHHEDAAVILDGFRLH